MKLRAIKPGNIHEGLDRQLLSQINKRFLAINEDRRKRLRSALGERQRRILDALPLLFHTNHPMMPGFVSRNTPARLSHFTLGKREIELGRQIARSFTANVDLEKSEEIYGIYVMGSVGTIAQSEKSDLDIWLCFKPGLPREAIESLNEKCLRISHWAMRLRLEVHFFLMDNEAFKRGQLSALNEESSGSAQRLLLLDEFYRTAIFLGGRKPLWWFVPEQLENQYEEYTKTLLEKRFLSEDSVIDFGGLPTLPDSEFVGAGIWQLYKAIESPYKSALKLLLLEAYADQHPTIQPLSLSFKAFVYEGEINIDELDSYVMIYRRIERYLLEKGAYKRLELARRCFYFKVNKPLSKPPHGREKSWQRMLLERLTEAWDWSGEQITMLDQRGHWKAPQVADERILLVNELNHSYRFIQEFAAETGAVRSISSEELTILGRKLQAAYERKPGKIEWINPGISNDVSESFISLSETYDKDSRLDIWTASARELDNGINGKQPVIKSAVNIVELMLWLYFNGVISNNTFFDLSKTPSINEYNLRKLLTSFHQWLPLPLKPLAHDTFKRNAVPSEVMLLLNVGKSPTPRLDERGIQRLSGQGDALSYSGFEENLVVSVDMITRNNWNEISTRRFEGGQALIHCLQEYLQLCMPGSHQRPPGLAVECIGNQHASTIASRVHTWFGEIIRCYYSGQYPSATRYIFELAEEYVSLQFKGPRLQVRFHRSLDQLLEFLSATQLTISPLMIDSRALKNHPLRTIAQCLSRDTGGRGWSGSINIFFQHFDIGMALYIVDEYGSVIYRQFQESSTYSPLRPLHHFLRAVIARQARQQQDMLYDFGIFPIHFYELLQHGQQTEVQSRGIPRELKKNLQFEVTAIAHPGADDRIMYDFYCDNQEFSTSNYADKIYLVTAQHILQQRKSRSHYPVYITDLDLSLCASQLSENGRLSTAHYLHIKHQLEARLNQAIGILLRT